MKAARGFTLIELLVAMAIVAIIGTIAFTGLNTVIDQQVIAKERIERWNEIQRAMRIIVQDLSQVHPRGTRDETGTQQLPGFIADPTRQFALEFSRGGWTNPSGFPRGSVLRVAYDIEQDTLVRFYWPVTDRTLSTPPGRVELLTGLLEMNVSYIDRNGNPTPDWPPQQAGNATGPYADRPRAVEISFDIEGLGRIWRLIEVSSS